MKIEQKSWSDARGWSSELKGHLSKDAQLAIVFAGFDVLKNKNLVAEVRAAYPQAHVVGCSTAGEILGDDVRDDTATLTAVRFDKTKIECARVAISDCANSVQAGERLAKMLPPEDLRHVFVISDGIKVNGSDLALGMRKALPEKVAVTGGLSGDNARFKETLVFLDDAPANGMVAAIGFYGPAIKIGFGSLGGWDPFGPERLVTGSRGNVLYSLDGQPALKLYKQYLGEHAAGLPATALLFPLNVRSGQKGDGLVRTILSVDEAAQSMTFAGDIPQGSHAKLMKASFDRLVDGAHDAAKLSRDGIGAGNPELAILVSCVGRKLLLKQRTEEEIDAVRDVLGKSAAVTGFYSYGEICPSRSNPDSELHNQTMTITTFSEA